MIPTWLIGIAKADEYEELPSERLGNKTSRKLPAA
jgi:hypothetical protein